MSHNSKHYLGQVLGQILGRQKFLLFCTKEAPVGASTAVVMERDACRVSPLGYEEQGCNSVGIFVGPESGKEPGPSHVWSFETCLNLECPNTVCSPEPGPVLCPVLGLWFKIFIELHPRTLGVWTSCTRRGTPASTGSRFAPGARSRRTSIGRWTRPSSSSRRGSCARERWTFTVWLGVASGVSKGPPCMCQKVTRPAQKR